MNEDRIQVVARLWNEILGSQTWSQESAMLRRSLKQLNRHELTIKETHRLLTEILSNKFFRKRMSQVFHKHENQMKSIILALEKTLGRRKEAARAMREFYLAKHQVRYGENETLDCELGSSRVKEILEDAIEQYSNDEFSKTFNKSMLAPALNEIEEKLGSLAFLADCLKILVADFAADAESPSANADTLRLLIIELVGQLIECGHDLEDLSSLSKSMMLPDGRSADERFKSVTSSLAENQRSYSNLTCLDDLRLPGDQSYKIGRVTFHGQEYDLSKQLVKMPPELNQIRDLLISQFSKKVVAEISTAAFGYEQAKELSSQEIAKAIDILSLEDPESVIREPSEEKNSRQIVLDDQMLPYVQAANRLELCGKELDISTRTNLDKILESLGAVLTKPTNQLTDFEMRILAGIHFYRKGNFAFDFRDKVVNYIVSLESMLVGTGEHPSSTLPKRVLDVIGVSEEYRSIVRRLMEDAYHHRGEILHLGLSDKRESKRFSREMRALDRRLLGVMLDYVGKPGCETLMEFLELLEKETLKERERLLKTAVLDINKQFDGSGVLKHSNGSDIGDIAFIFSYKDDGRYVYMLGSITTFKLRGDLKGDTGCYIVGKIHGIDGIFRLDLSVLFNSFDLMGLISGERNTLPFQVGAISKS